MQHTQPEYRCPLCKSAVSRVVYEEILRISEARKAEIAQAEADVQKKLEQVELNRDEIARRAAQAERRKVAAEAAKAQKGLGRKIEQLQREAKKERMQFQRSLKEAAHAAKLDKDRLEVQHRKDVSAAEKNVRKLSQEIQRLRKEAQEERRRAKRGVAERIREAKKIAAAPLLLSIQDLRDSLKTLEDRRRREEESWKRTIAELKQKADSHERAHFGPEGEEQLVAALKEAFPADTIERRGRGGDVIHAVIENGRTCGRIVYECKRTRDWNIAYTRQLKKAMEAHNTKYGLLVSRTLPPKSNSGLCVANKVLVVEPHLAAQVAGILRETIVALDRARLSEEGKATKTAEIYKYLQSDDFSNAIARIDDKIKELRASLDKEKSSHDGWWRSREQYYATILREASGIDSRIKEILSARQSEGLAKVHRLR